MCKTIKDILWPLNIFGKKMQIIKVPMDMEAEDPYKLYIAWEGERLAIKYTNDSIHRPIGRPEFHKYLSQTVNLDTEGDVEVELEHSFGAWPTLVKDNMVYAKCTNVTALIINGVQYI